MPWLFELNVCAIAAKKVEKTSCLVIRHRRVTFADPCKETEHVKTPLTAAKV